jgi:hypothetical protein
MFENMKFRVVTALANKSQRLKLVLVSSSLDSLPFLKLQFITMPSQRLISSWVCAAM